MREFAPLVVEGVPGHGPEPTAVVADHVGAAGVRRIVELGDGDAELAEDELRRAKRHGHGAFGGKEGHRRLLVLSAGVPVAHR